MAYSCLVPLASVKIQLNRFMLILFCRVTLCVSAEPPIVRCPSVCLSVRLSHWCIVYYTEMSKDTIKLFPRPGGNDVPETLQDRHVVTSDD